MNKIICVKELYKNYGTVRAVNGVSFDVKQGDLFAFLGTNGAGKSTTIDILTTLIRKTKGEVTIDGLTLGTDDSDIKKIIGAVFQNSVLDQLLTVKENLMVRGGFYSFSRAYLRERIHRVSEITGCESFMNQRYGKLSGGQKRRVDIANALINEPKILFLDEPTTGLDPSTRISIWETIASMQKTMKMTVFLTTHYMEEAAKADDVIVIQNGTIIAQGSPKELKEKYTSNRIKIYQPSEGILQRLQSEEIPYKLEKQVLSISVPDAQYTIELLSDLKDKIDSFEVVNGNMDDVFMNIIHGETGEQD